MTQLAPEIYRQRLLIEGIYQIDVSKETIGGYFQTMLRELHLTTYQEPTIHSSEGTAKPENQGFEAFLPLIESGIAVYTWGQSRLFSVLLFTCKPFDEKKAIEVTSQFFKLKQLESRSF